MTHLGEGPPRSFLASPSAASPLSYGQRALWFLYQLAPKSAAYNIFYAVRIRSPLNIPALRCALQALLDCHPAVRTTYHGDNGQPVQQIHSHQEVSFTVADATTWSQKELDARLADEAHRPFELERGPIYRTHLFTRSAQDHILLLAGHHIALDGWSLGILLEELLALYATATTGRPVPLPGLRMDYAAYVTQQAQRLAGQNGQRLWAYWQKQLAGPLPALNLPTDRPRPPTQTDRGAVRSYRFDATLTRQLTTLARREGTTLYVILLAAFQVLLHRYSGQTEFLVGSPVTDRGRADFATVIGYFINILPLRAELSNDPSFTACLRQVHHTVRAARAHRTFPFPLLVERLLPDRDPSRSPLFQVMFVMQTARVALESFAFCDTGQRMHRDGLLLESVAVPHRTAQFDLTLELLTLDGTLIGSWQYNTDLFNADTVARMAAHFQTLLEGIVAYPDQRLSKLPLLTAPEHGQLLVDWNATQTEYPKAVCLHELVEAQAERTPNAVAVVFENQQLTYRELNAKANQLAHALQRRGVSPEVCVGLCVERSLELVIGLLGILKAGGAYVPLDPSYPPERLAFMLKDTQVPLILTQQHLRDALPAPPGQVLCLDTDGAAIAQESPENPTCPVHPANLAYVLYTSGSTGQPKGIAMPHQALTNLVCWQLQHSRVSGQARTLQFASLNFDVSCQECFSTWGAGGTLVLMPEDLRRDPVALRHFLIQMVVERLFAPVVTLQQLAEVTPNRTSIPTTLREIIIAGEPLHISPQIAEFFTQIPGCTLHNQYGPSETHVATALTLTGSPSEWPARPPIGRPIANTQLYVLDQRLQPVPIGVPGELYIAGVGLARGYLNRPELTAERFLPNPFSDEPGERMYKTGDLARYLPDGNLEFLGRIDAQVKLRGFRIELGEVEAILAKHPAVQQALVLLREDHHGDKRLVAYLVPHQPPGPTTSDLYRFLKQILPEYMIPAAFVILEKFPLTPSGKIDRRAMPTPEHTRPELEKVFTAPRTALEEVLARIWAEVLGLERVGIHDNFFELGGHSLLATQIVSRLQDAFRIDLPLHRLFEEPTVAGLASLMREDPHRRDHVERTAQMLLRIARLSDDEAKVLLDTTRAVPARAGTT